MQHAAHISLNSGFVGIKINKKYLYSHHIFNILMRDFMSCYAWVLYFIHNNFYI
jgi:hypothetical protein